MAELRPRCNRFEKLLDSAARCDLRRAIHDGEQALGRAIASGRFQSVRDAAGPIPPGFEDAGRLTQLLIEFGRATDLIKSLHAPRDPQDEQLLAEALDWAISLFAELGEMLLYAQTTIEDAQDWLSDAQKALRAKHLGRRG